MIDKDTTMQLVEERFNEVMAAEAELIKKIEAFRSIDEGWAPETQEEMEIMMPIAQEIDMRINFVVRQLLIRYGNLLFI